MGISKLCDYSQSLTPPPVKKGFSVDGKQSTTDSSKLINKADHNLYTEALVCQSISWNGLEESLTLSLPTQISTEETIQAHRIPYNIIYL